MTRSELNDATAKFLAKGGKVTKLPDGPDFRDRYSTVQVKESLTVDLTATQDPANAKQENFFEKKT